MRRRGVDQAQRLGRRQPAGLAARQGWHLEAGLIAPAAGVRVVEDGGQRRVDGAALGRRRRVLADDGGDRGVGRVLVDVPQQRHAEAVEMVDDARDVELGAVAALLELEIAQRRLLEGNNSTGAVEGCFI